MPLTYGQKTFYTLWIAPVSNIAPLPNSPSLPLPEGFKLYGREDADPHIRHRLEQAGNRVVIFCTSKEGRYLWYDTLIANRRIDDVVATYPVAAA